MKHKLFTLFLAFTASVGMMNAEVVASGDCGYSGSGSSVSSNVTWTLTDDGTITLDGTGMIYTWSSSSSVPWYSYRNSIKNVVIGEGITGYRSNYSPYYLFNSCENLSTVEWNAINCSNTGSFPIFGSSGNSNPIATFTFGENVQTIPNYLCYSLNNVTSISLPETITSIGDYAFSGCSKLVSINIPSSVTSIGNRAFYECSQLASPIVLPEGISSIGNYTFYRCSSLSSVSLPSTLTSIGSDAFSQCSSLTTIEIPAGVTSIGDYAFSSCYKLISINIPSGVTSIGKYTFANCNLLASPIVIPEGISSIGEDAFKNCSSLPSVSLPSTLTSIGSEAFYGCISLTSIDIPANVESIGASAFSGCTQMASVTLPSGLSRINENTFNGCTGLSELTIPSSVIYIGKDALPVIGHVTLGSTTPPTVITFPFFGTAIVPAEALETYKTAWPDYANYIIANNPAVNNQSITVTAKSDKSTIHMAIGDANLEQVTSLKVTGTINSYDIMIIRNKMINLQELDLTDADIVANSYEYYTGICSKDSVLTSYAFTDTQIRKAKLPRSLKQIDRYTFNASKLHCLEINGGTMVASAFYEYNKLDSLRINNVTSIPNYCFSGCTSLKSVTLSYPLQTIGNAAFARCSNLRSITLPSSLTTIGRGAFMGAGLTSVTIPSNVSAIGEFAFAGSNSSSSMTINTEGQFYTEIIPIIVSNGKFSLKGNTYSTSLVGELQPDVEYYLYNSTCYPTKYENGTHYYYSGSKWYSISSSNWTSYSRTFTMREGQLVCLYKNTSFSPVYYGEGNSDYFSYTNYSNYRRAGGSLQSVVFAPGSKLTTFSKSIFDGNYNLTSIVFPQNLQWISHEALAGCAIDSLVIPETVTFIDNLAFVYANSRYIALPKSIKEINAYTVAYCPKLKEMVIPTNVETIADYAFYGCENLEMIKVASSIRNIGNYAFSKCSNVKKVYTYTVEPTQIDQNTFSCWLNANLYVPYTSYYTYFYNTQWSQFLRLVEFDEPYDYFYVNNDYELGANGTIEGEPDVDLNPGSGLIVSGGETQYLGDVTQHITDDYSAAIVACQDALVCNRLNIHISMNKGVWYYLCFPFNLSLSYVTWPGQYAIYEYEGAIRAQNGSGGWKRCTTQTLTAGKGYIIQSSVTGNATINIANPVFSCETFTQPLPVHNAAAAYDANWTLIGNPFPAYYDMDDLFAAGFNAPVYVFNKSRNDYDVYMPHDDEYHFHPYEAFFVQNPDLAAGVINWTGDGRETLIQSQIQNKKAPARRVQQADNRRFVELNLAETEGENADHTRIVFNPSAQMQYELGTDAVKMQGEAPVRLYSIEDNVQLAINERPYENGYTALGFHVAIDGYYTLSAARLDTSVIIYDNVLQQQVDLQNGDYTFYSNAGTDNTRFGICMAPQTATSLESVQALFGGPVNVYTVMGVQLYKEVEASQLQLPAGIYVVQSNELTRTVILK